MSTRSRYRPWFLDGKQQPKRPDPKPAEPEDYVLIEYVDTGVAERMDEIYRFALGL